MGLGFEVANQFHNLLNVCIDSVFCVKISLLWPRNPDETCARLWQLMHHIKTNHTQLLKWLNQKDWLGNFCFSTYYCFFLLVDVIVIFLSTGLEMFVVLKFSFPDAYFASWPSFGVPWPVSVSANLLLYSRDREIEICQICWWLLVHFQVNAIDQVGFSCLYRK
jgi:hypothetical protein